MKVTIVGGWDKDSKNNEAWKLDIDNRKKAELQAVLSDTWTIVGSAKARSFRRK